MVQIQGYKVNKLHMENTVANGTELQLQNQVKYNVNYMDDVHKCVGILSFRITDGNMNPFEVQIDMVAEFTYDEGDDKADIHTQSFDQIYPFLRQIVSQMAGHCGVPGLMIPIMRLNKDTVTVQHLAYEQDKIERLLDDPSLLRTPIVRNGRQATIGYCPDVWKTWE